MAQSMDNTPEIMLIDGAEASTISVLDRGLHYGDGVFETIACRNGQPRFLGWHLERLALGCERLRIRFDALPTLTAEIKRLAGASALSLIKVIVTRGVATARGYGAKGDETATRVVLRYSWPQEDSNAWQNGVVVRIADQRLGENPRLAGLKHLNRLEQVLARAEWSDSGIAEALMFSDSGLLVAGTMSNVFLVRDGKLFTPRIDRCGVSGVMRRAVLQEASRARIAREECDLRADDLDRAEEIFLTNARIGIWPVRALSARAFTPGPLTRRLQQLLWPLLQEPRDDTAAAEGAKDSEKNAGTPRGAASTPAAPEVADEERHRRG
jgi:4-amino-4-deoxychorismate lyase